MNSISNVGYIKNPSTLISISVYVFITLLVIDFIISTISDIISGFVKSNIGFVLFTVLVTVSLTGGYISVVKIFKILEEKRSLVTKYKNLFLITQIVSYSLSIFLLLDIIFENKYYTLNLMSIVSISYGTSIAINLFASIKLFVWFKQNKNKFSFLFGLSIFSIFVNNLISIILFNTLLLEKPAEFDLSTPIIFNFECNEPTFYCAFKQSIIHIQSYTLMTYFLLFWICNNFLLHHHIKKIGKIKFFTLVALPVVAFYFVFIYHYDILYSLGENFNFDEGIIFAIQISMVVLFITLCGISYGIGLRSVANLLKVSPTIERYLKLASYGIILFFISANATVVGAGLPPYGIPNIIFLPFASLLMYVGIYYSIISISNDIKVKKYIKNSTFNELKILGNLADAQTLDNMKERVFKMSKTFAKELHQKSSSESTQTEEDLKNYLEDAIKIFKRKDFMKSD